MKDTKNVTVRDRVGRALWMLPVQLVNSLTGAAQPNSQPWFRGSAWTQMGSIIILIALGLFGGYELIGHHPALTSGAWSVPLLLLRSLIWTYSFLFALLCTVGA